MPLDADVPLVGVAGTVTTVVAMALGLEAYRPERLHGAEITAAEVRDVTDATARDGPRRTRGACR